MSDLLVRLKLDDKGLNAQLKGVSSKFALAAKGLAAIAIPVAAVTAIAKTISGLAAIGEQAINTIAPLQDTSAQLGVTAERLQELRLVAGNAGVDIGEFDKALGILNRTLGKVSLGQGEFEKVARTAGIAIRDEQGHIKTTAEVWDALTAKIQSGAISQNEAIGLAAAAFGREGGKMVQVLRQTAAEQQKVIDTARQFGAIISNEVVRSADEYEDKLALIHKGTEALSAQTGLLLAPLTLAWAQLKNEVVLYGAALLGLPAAEEAALQKSIARIEAEVADFQAQIASGERRSDAMSALLGLPPNAAEDLERQLESSKQKLMQLRAELKKITDSSQDTENLGHKAGAGEQGLDQSLLETIEVNAEKIEVMRSFNQMMLDAEREASMALLDQEIEVNALRIEANRSLNQVLADANEQFRQQNLTDTQRYWEAQVKMWNAETTSAADRTSTLLALGVKLTEGRAQQSKKNFDLNKKFAIAEATINAYRSIAQVWADETLPFFAKIAATAVTAAAAFQNVSAIKNTSFQGGGGGTTPSAAGGAVVNGNPVAGAAASGGGGGVIRVEGIDSNSLFTGRAMRELLERLQEALKDGGKLVVA